LRSRSIISLVFWRPTWLSHSELIPKMEAAKAVLEAAAI